MSDIEQFLESHELSERTSVAVKLLKELQPAEKVVKRKGVTAGKQLQVVLGNRKWVGLNGFEVSSEVDNIIISNEKSGQTVILVGINGKNVIWGYSCVTKTHNASFPYNMFYKAQLYEL